jgi:hypothetical protein
MNMLPRSFPPEHSSTSTSIKINDCIFPFAMLFYEPALRYSIHTLKLYYTVPPNNLRAIFETMFSQKIGSATKKSVRRGELTTMPI